MKMYDEDDVKNEDDNEDEDEDDEDALKIRL